MTFEQDTHIAKGMRFIVRTWKCCGNQWELLISKATFKDRYKWKPVCPNCGGTITHWKDRLVKPDPLPRYDDIYFEGTEWLDGL
jgi:hypothetical protein